MSSHRYAVTIGVYSHPTMAEPALPRAVAITLSCRAVRRLHGLELYSDVPLLCSRMEISDYLYPSPPHAQGTTNELSLRTSRTREALGPGNDQWTKCPYAPQPQLGPTCSKVILQSNQPVEVADMKGARDGRKGYLKAWSNDAHTHTTPS